jgi:hypothetical protein
MKRRGALTAAATHARLLSSHRVAMSRTLPAVTQRAVVLLSATPGLRRREQPVFWRFVRVVGCLESGENRVARRGIRDAKALTILIELPPNTAKGGMVIGRTQRSRVTQEEKRTVPSLSGTSPHGKFRRRQPICQTSAKSDPEAVVRREKAGSHRSHLRAGPQARGQGFEPQISDPELPGPKRASFPRKCLKRLSNL